MVFIHIESRDRSLNSAEAAEDIRGGNLIRVEGNEAYNATATDGVDGVAASLGAAAWAAMTDEDYRDPYTKFVYSTETNKYGPVPYGDLREDGQRLRLRTPDDPEDGSPAPNIGAQTVVGVTDLYAGRLVEEGYSPDGGVTVYDRASGNFVPVGVARGNAPTVPCTEFDELVHIFNDDF